MVRGKSVADQRCDGSIVAAIAGARVVGAAESDVLWDAALDRHARACLPTGEHGVGNPIMEVQELVLPYRKIVSAAGHKSMTSVERGARPLTAQASAVLRK